MFLNGQYPNFKPHRSLSVSSEFGLYIKRLLTMPYNRIHRRIATSRIAWGGFPYHLVLLQLEHDASFQIHSRFGTMAEFLEEIVENFAKSAPKHHHLVFKSHPLEDGRAKIRKSLNSICEKYGVPDRVHYVRGGKLARLLNAARSAITVNSTAGQQVLWRDDLEGAQRMVYVLDLTQPNGMFQARDFVIRDQDTVYVTEAPFTQWNKTIAALTGSLGSAQTLTNQATSLSGN